MADETKRVSVQYILDSSGFNESLQGVNANLKLNKSALKDAEVGVKAFGDSTGNLQKVQSALKDTMQTAQEKVDIYSKSIAKTTTTMEENILKRDQLKTALDMEKSKLEGATSAYGKNSEVAENAKTRVAELTEQYNNVDKAVTQNAKSIESYTTKMNTASAEAKNLEGQLNKTTKNIAESQSGWLNAGKSLESGSKSFKTIGKSANEAGDAILKVTAPVVVGLGLATKSASDFEHQMADIKKEVAATGIPVSQVNSLMAEMSTSSLKWSEDFGQSTDDINQGLLTLVKDGYTAGEAMSTMNTSLLTARGSNEELGTTVDKLGSSLEAYGMKTNDAATTTANMSHMADTFAYTANHTKASISSLGEAFSIVGPLASQLKIPMSQTAAAIGELQSNGIDASTAATSLQAGLVNLTKPTTKMQAALKEMNFSAFDSQGKMKDLTTIIAEMSQRTAGWTDKQRESAYATIFGKESLASWGILMHKGSDYLSNLSTNANNATGEVQHLSDSMKNTSQNNFKELEESVHALGIAFGQDVLPILTPLVKDVTGVVKSFSDLDDGTKKTIIDVVGLATAAGLGLKVVGGAAGSISNILGLAGKISGAIGKATVATEAGTAAATGAGEAIAGTAVAEGAGATATAGLGVAFGAAILPIAAVVGVVAAVGVGSYALYKHMTNDAIPTVDLFNSKYQASEKVLNSYGETVQNTVTKTINFTDATKKNVGAYMQMDDNVKKTMTDISVNSDNFTKQTKTNVVAQYTDMVSKVSGLNANMKDKNITDFTNMVTNTSTLTTKNKNDIVAQYTQMVSKVGGLTAQQKADTIKKFTDTMTQSVGITKSEADNVVAQFTAMGTKIKGGMDTQYNDRLTKMKDFFAKSDVLSVDDEQKILTNMTNDNNTKKAKIDGYEAQIAAIQDNAVAHHRDTTTQEKAQINAIQDSMRVTAVKSLSDSEIQSKVILERMKSYGTSITEEEASSIIQNANSQRDKSIKAANDQCDQTVAEITYERDVTHTINKDQADKLIKNAESQRDQSVKAAKEQRDQVVDHLSKMDSDVISNMNTDTGKMLNPWQKLTKSIGDEFNKIAKSWNDLTFTQKVAKVVGAVTGNTAIGQNASGTNNFQGYLTTMHERGYEVYQPPQGTKIYNHEASEDMVKKTAESVAEKVASKMVANSNGGTTMAVTFDHVTINGYSDLQKVARDLNNMKINNASGIGGN
ncbi:phage tail tape measure protein, TP901 family, core region [Clostridium acidisoli DSM 12555]|uniref:Phage tail tape measure protein, TP901 family, core region n=1 Tax=Clostridium acidisoli DSM 12555 TaxID=1121291 RepID=A0A1W1X6F0_9CLOT|nr:phage tail tape measure protein [Clostridium acidisoli]SMC19298.1 phage tail tape measure protein, TP901 family, core region [Clostridium acidisoli DSM 12555]